MRIPAHDFLRSLLGRTGVLVVTSANPHGTPTPRTAQDVADRLGPSVDLVVDGGQLEDVPSTLVNVRGRSRWSSAKVRSRGRTWPTRWRRHGDPVAARSRDVVRRDGGRGRRRLAVRALFGGGQPDRPARRVRRGRPRAGQPRPPGDADPDHRAGPARGGCRRGGPGRRGGHVGSGPRRRAAGRDCHGQGARVGLGHPRRGGQPSGGPPGQRVPDRGRGAVPAAGAPRVRWPLHAHPFDRAGRYELLGETVDDSIGEAYDKVARFLGLGYPGGPVLDRLAATGEDVLGFPRPMLAEGYTFSFSGLKTAVVNHVRADPGFSETEVAASFVAACMDVLIAKLRRALEEFGDPAVAIVGGVAASPILRARAPSNTWLCLLDRCCTRQRPQDRAGRHPAHHCKGGITELLQSTPDLDAQHIHTGGDERGRDIGHDETGLLAHVVDDRRLEARKGEFVALRKHGPREVEDISSRRGQSIQDRATGVAQAQIPGHLVVSLADGVVHGLAEEFIHALAPGAGEHAVAAGDQERGWGRGRRGWRGRRWPGGRRGGSPPRSAAPIRGPAT